jgi:hypothetical protein
MTSREDNFKKIIEGVISAGEVLKRSCESLFDNTANIYQNLTLMIEDDFSNLKKISGTSFDSEKQISKKFKKYLSAKLVSRIQNLSYDFTKVLNFEDLKSSQSKLIKELRGRKYLDNDQMAMLLDRSGLSRRDDQSVAGSDMLNQSLNMSTLSPKYDFSPSIKRRSKLSRSGMLPKMNLLGLGKHSPTKGRHRRGNSGFSNFYMSANHQSLRNV